MTVLLAQFAKWVVQIAGGVFVEDTIRAICTAALGTSTCFPVAFPVQSVETTAGESNQHLNAIATSTLVPTATPVQSVEASARESNQHLAVSRLQSEREAAEAQCPQAPAPQLAVGSKAIRVGTIKSVLRNAVGLTARDLGRVKVGEKVHVLDGPLCVDEFNWYKLETEDGRVGWVAEGHYRAKRYWYVTLLDDSSCDLPPRFIPGDIATHNGDLRNIVRDLPDRMSDERGSKIHFGNTVEVLVGPVCNDSHIWYWVQNETLGIEGWTAEGFEGEYWFKEPKRFYN